MPRFTHTAVRRSLVLLPLFLTGCQALYFLEGNGSQAALFTLPKDARVLVFVDSPASVELPPTYATTLGNAINDHLFKNKATTHVVGQERLSAMRSDPTFAKLGVADVAKATATDIVIYVDIVTFNTALTGGDAVSQGNAQALVKVIDKDGKRLWPTNQPSGYPVEAHVEENLADQRDQTATQKEISDHLTTHVGRIFHKYSLDDKEMTE